MTIDTGIIKEIDALFEKLTKNGMEKLVEDQQTGPCSSTEYMEPITQMANSKNIERPFMLCGRNTQIYAVQATNKLRIETDMNINNEETDLTVIFYARNDTSPYDIYLYDIKVL